MSNMATHTLKISHGTSRARDTDGYPTVTLTDELGRKAKCMGGGYDMFGTVLASWICAAYPERVAKLGERAYYTYKPGQGTIVNRDGLYGVHHDSNDGKTRIDGAVGVSTVERMAREELGLTIKATVNAAGRVTGWTVED
ncbi:hypothetical protein UB45_07720 [Terrabacter sp. 28]|nr:hypothetical protein UB45_07720 [Terrabacter sp. 28]